MIAVLILAQLGISALSPTYSVSSAYRNSGYYKNLCSLELCGDNRCDTVSVALSQIGYHEGNSTAEFDGSNSTGVGNYTEYNYLFGKLDGNGDGSVEYGYAWCAAFVSWCLRQAGVSTDTVRSFASCTLWVEYFTAKNQFYKRASGYVPKSGDIIFFCQPTTARISDHVGIVVFCDGSTVYTVEGNCTNQVKRRSYSINDTYIVGYGVPDYKTAEQTTDFSLSGGYVPGKYIITASGLNMRNGAGTAYTSLLKIPLGTMLSVSEIKSGWGKVEYNGKSGWISLDYTSVVSTYNTSETAAETVSETTRETVSKAPAETSEKTPAESVPESSDTPATTPPILNLPSIMQNVFGNMTNRDTNGTTDPDTDTDTDTEEDGQASSTIPSPDILPDSAVLSASQNHFADSDSLTLQIDLKKNAVIAVIFLLVLAAAVIYYKLVRRKSK